MKIQPGVICTLDNESDSLVLVIDTINDDKYKYLNLTNFPNEIK